jgi:hypothetical protein
MRTPTQIALGVRQVEGAEGLETSDAGRGKAVGSLEDDHGAFGVEAVVAVCLEGRIDDALKRSLQRLDSIAGVARTEPARWRVPD